MEIGFNEGHSAETFLSTNKNIKLVSFDIEEHNCDERDISLDKYNI
tara:strand:- start:10385 stop:10522 length:138 start_codon:yes stop_codon:yes gene_type:complete